MEKNIQLTAGNNANIVDNLMSMVKKPFNFMRNYYSGVIGKKVSVKQTWLLTEVQIAFIFAVFPVEANLLLRAAAVIWLISSLLRTKASFETA